MMALFGWLFGTRPQPRQYSEAPKPQPPSNAPTKAPQARPANPALDFFGAYRRSPNGRFRVAWRDDHGTRGGARDAGEGHYVVIDDDRIVAHGRMQRPNRFNNGLSADGTFAACHTCNSGSESDSSVLAIFDLSSGEELTRFRAESGWPNTYEFLPDERILRLGYPNGEGEFAYTLNGEFIERDRWISARLERGDLYMVRSLLDEADGKPEDNLAIRLLSAVDAGLSHRNWRDDQSQALGWRLRGEVRKSMGAPSEALELVSFGLKTNARLGSASRTL